MPRPNTNIENATLLQAALDGLEAQKSKIEEQIVAVQRMLGHRRGRPPGSGKSSAAQPKSPVADAPAQKRPMSAASRKRIARAQKRRWAEYHKRAAAAAK
ncbi:MAG: hypothetical protein ABSG25_04280 [Bryobacteraceae bacterium]